MAAISPEQREAWRERVAACRASGQAVAAWCRAQQIKEYQMRYWLRRFPPAEVPDGADMQWLSVSMGGQHARPRDAGLVVRVGHAAIEVQPGFDPALLADVVGALAGAC